MTSCNSRRISMISFCWGLGAASMADRRGRFSASVTIRSIAARSRLSPMRLILSPVGPVLQELRRLLLGFPVLHEIVGVRYLGEDFLQNRARLGPAGRLVVPHRLGEKLAAHEVSRPCLHGEPEILQRLRARCPTREERDCRCLVMKSAQNAVSAATVVRGVEQDHGLSVIANLRGRPLFHCRGLPEGES